MTVQFEEAAAVHQTGCISQAGLGYGIGGQSMRAQFLNDGDIETLVERAAGDSATRLDLARYLHHAELISRLAAGEPGPDASAKYLEEFRAKYHLSS